MIDPINKYKYIEPVSTPRSRQHTYYEVEKLQLYLTEEEEIKILTDYNSTRTELHNYILSKAKCRAWFLANYKNTLNSGKSISKLSSAFDPSDQGRNSIIKQNMKQKMTTNKGVAQTEKEMLFGLKISEFCYSEMIKLIVPPTKKLIVMQEKIRQFEDTLLRSMLMAAHEIAIRNTSTVYSIDAMDAAQEVTMYCLESIRKYDPEYRTPQGKRVKLCTYAYGRANKLIQEWVLTTSRLVRIPRSKMARILIVIKAYDEILADSINLDLLTTESNTILRGRKGELTKIDEFTIEEVEELIKVMTNNYVRFDQPYNPHSRTNNMTIGDMISNNETAADDLVEAQHTKEHLLKIMKEHLTELELQIITLRYFHGCRDNIPRALTDVSNILMSVYNAKDCCRESIRQIEKTALSKLKDIKEVQELW